MFFPLIVVVGISFSFRLVISTKKVRNLGSSESSPRNGGYVLERDNRPPLRIGKQQERWGMFILVPASGDGWELGRTLVDDHTRR